MISKGLTTKVFLGISGSTISGCSRALGTSLKKTALSRNVIMPMRNSSWLIVPGRTTETEVNQKVRKINSLRLKFKRDRVTQYWSKLRILLIKKSKIPNLFKNLALSPCL